MSALVAGRALPSAAAGERARTHPTAWWGMVMLIATEATLFAGLLSSYFYLRGTSEEWPLGGLPRPSLMPVSILSVVLVGSSVPVHLGERAIRRGRITALRTYLAIGFVMGAAFFAYTAWDLTHAEFDIGENAYASIFHTTVGLHALHVLVGLLMSAGVQVKAATGRIRAERHLSVQLFVMYWHFVDAVWLAVFASLYLSVR
ncbi:MAG TPA: cytochrome c oxidase subunit 3 [Acidimicrobiales bacterium]|jgi:heme/copper-type cytochrome/quinol oxidase subunit 3|nr:cytochrome c oxidase subunit 3 [Acidimicrobiales bacterium]